MTQAAIVRASAEADQPGQPGGDGADAVAGQGQEHEAAVGDDPVAQPAHEIVVDEHDRAGERDGQHPDGHDHDGDRRRRPQRHDGRGPTERDDRERGRHPGREERQRGGLGTLDEARQRRMDGDGADPDGDRRGHQQGRAGQDVRRHEDGIVAGDRHRHQAHEAGDDGKAETRCRGTHGGHRHGAFERGDDHERACRGDRQHGRGRGPDGQRDADQAQRTERRQGQLTLPAVGQADDLADQQSDTGRDQEEAHVRVDLQGRRADGQ